jgi:hypothetical protein
LIGREQSGIEEQAKPPPTTVWIERITSIHLLRIRRGSEYLPGAEPEAEIARYFPCSRENKQGFFFDQRRNPQVLPKIRKFLFRSRELAGNLQGISRFPAKPFKRKGILRNTVPTPP